MPRIRSTAAKVVCPRSDRRLSNDSLSVQARYEGVLSAVQSALNRVRIGRYREVAVGGNGRHNRGLGRARNERAGCGIHGDRRTDFIAASAEVGKVSECHIHGSARRVGRVAHARDKSIRRGRIGLGGASNGSGRRHGEIVQALLIRSKRGERGRGNEILRVRRTDDVHVRCPCINGHACTRVGLGSSEVCGPQQLLSLIGGRVELRHKCIRFGSRRARCANRGIDDHGRR